MELSFTDVASIGDLLNKSVQLLDESRFEDWLTLYMDDAKYVILCKDGVTASGSYVIDTDRDGIAARLDLLKDPSRIREQTTRRHIAMWGTPKCTTSENVEIVSSFSFFETRLFDGASRLAYVGTYRDVLRRTGQGWRFAARNVDLDTFAFKSLLVPL